MSEPTWYVYQNSNQLGPFAIDPVLQMVETGMIAQDAFLFKVGWKDWRPLKQCYEELGLPVPENEDGQAHATDVNQDPGRNGAPRASIKGRIIVHNNGHLIIGSGINISASGIFVETKDQIFEIGEKLRLTCKISNFTQNFHVSAEVIRFNEDLRYPVGYGLKFLDLDPNIAASIQQLLDEENAGGAKKDHLQAN